MQKSSSAVFQVDISKAKLKTFNKHGLQIIHQLADRPGFGRVV